MDGDGLDLAWRGGHTIQCTGDVLYSGASETSIILLTSVTTVNAMKRKKRKEEAGLL